MSISDLVEQNPFWREVKTIDEDKSIKIWKKSSFKWRPRLMDVFDWNIDVIYTLRGPRQVGKTTLSKLKIKDLLKEEKIDTRRIFYWSCDLVESPEKLVGIVSRYIDWIRQYSTNRLYIFLDEISSVRDWQRGIKFLFDKGKLENCTVVLTGSHSIDIRKASESLAGRRGEVEKLRTRSPDKIMLPLKFSEYAETRSEKIYEIFRDMRLLATERRKRLVDQLARGNRPRELEELMLYSNELESLLEEYFITGGIPRAIDGYISQGSISEDVYHDYVNLVTRDVLRWGGREAYLRQILQMITQTLTNPVSWNEFARETDLGSHNTVANYVDILRDTYVVSVVYFLDKNKGRPFYRKNKKIHFLDPFIFHSLRSWALGISPFEATLNFLKNTENKGKLVECIVGNHLIRFMFNISKSPVFDYANNIFYWQSKKKREVDFVLKYNKSYLPIEVKYQPALSKSDVYGMFDFEKTQSHNGIIISKNTLKVHRNYVEIPCHIFLLLA